MAILIRTEEWRPNLETSFATTVYEVIFFPTPELEDLIMTAEVFLGFSAFYLPISFLWAAVSGILLWALWIEVWDYVKRLLYAWCIVTGIITILDFIVMILFSVDIANIYDNEWPPEKNFRVQATLGIVMTIAARGYIILGAHVFFLVVLSAWALQINVIDYGHMKLTMSPNSWHTTGSLPRISLVSQNGNSRQPTSQDMNHITSQMEFPPSKFPPGQLENFHSRPQSMDPHLAHIFRQQEEHKRVSKPGPPPPPKPSALRPNSRYY